MVVVGGLRAWWSGCVCEEVLWTDPLRIARQGDNALTLSVCIHCSFLLRSVSCAPPPHHQPSKTSPYYKQQHSSNDHELLAKSEKSQTLSAVRHCARLWYAKLRRCRPITARVVNLRRNKVIEKGNRILHFPDCSSVVIVN